MQEQTLIDGLTSLPQNKCEELYSLAYTHFENKEYTKAKELFTMLLIANGLNYDYWHGYASTLFSMQQWYAAAKSYSSCALLDKNNPEPHLYASICFIKMGEKEDAIKACSQLEKLDRNKHFVKQLAQLKKEIKEL